MKKLITIWITCSLALAASAFAQQEEPTPKKKPQEKAHAEKQEKPAPKAEAPARAKPRPVRNTPETENPRAKAAAEQRAKEQNAREAKMAKKPATPMPAREHAQANAHPAQPANKARPQPNRPMAKQTKKLDTKTVQTIKAQHANFHAQPKPSQVPAVTFRQNYRITNAQHWQGPQYAAFRSYHPQMHNQGWYHSHYNRIVLIGGGYYYWNNGYWYPAWGYNPQVSYYAYDGPIYAGATAEPPDQVIADVQAALQQQGYYHGEVDGLLGPLTQQALTDYQANNGLYTTATIDEPTLQSLGMAG